MPLLIVPVQAILTDEPWNLFVLQGPRSHAAWALAVGFYAALMAGLAPTFARARVVGVMTSLAAAVFGGTAPYLYTWLSSMAMAWAFHAYLTALAVMTIIVALRMKETRGIDLHEEALRPVLRS